MAEQINIELKAESIPFGTTGLQSPTIYAEYIRGAMLNGAVAKLALVENRFDVSADEVRTIHVASLVVPIDQIRAWANFFTEQADQLEIELAKRIAAAAAAMAEAEAEAGKQDAPQT